ncbi:hypothetical protein ACFY1P_33995 [Streptomyces sp. NPDC001407]|uniref:hypothetical protein n=1 Tax=Streptomyces sp. NPDC001407 TaxID=3364573 RepID=UPI00369FDAA9
MPWETRSFTVTNPALLTDDPASNTIVAALTAIEDEMGERQGWDRPPRLFTLRVLPGERVEAAFVPKRLWNPGDNHPADALWRRAGSLPPVPPIVLPGDAHQARVSALGFMFEGWGRPADEELPPHLAQLAQRGARVNHRLSSRQEVRIVHAIDLNQHAFQVGRNRGAQPRADALGRRGGHSEKGYGTIPAALARMMHAMRHRGRLFPGQPF